MDGNGAQRERLDLAELVGLRRRVGDRVPARGGLGDGGLGRAAGAPLAAAAVWAIIDLVKSLGAPIAGHERLAAFALSYAIVAVAVFVGIGERPPRYTLDALFLIGGLLSGYSIFRLALATHDDLSRMPNSLTGQVIP